MPPNGNRNHIGRPVHRLARLPHHPQRWHHDSVRRPAHHDRGNFQPHLRPPGAAPPTLAIRRPPQPQPPTHRRGAAHAPNHRWRPAIPPPPDKTRPQQRHRASIYRPDSGNPAATRPQQSPPNSHRPATTAHRARPPPKTASTAAANARQFYYDNVLSNRRLTAAANPLRLDRRPRHRKPHPLRRLQQRMRQIRILNLRRLPALPADQKLRRMVMPLAMVMRINAPDKRAQPLDPMHEPLLQQEIQRPIDRRRCRRPPMPAQPLQQVVRPRRRRGIQHQPEHQPPQRGQPRPPPLTQSGGPIQLGNRRGGEFRCHPCNVARPRN